jgi:dihydroorotase (multifunctional complex type)
MYKIIKEVWMMDLLIRNGCVVSPEGRYLADIAVDGGKITGIFAANSVDDKGANKVIDAQGLYVLPGCMDPHVHFREPGHTYKEDFGTGSAAAVAGGFTTVYDMPNNIPRIEGKDELEQKLAIVKGRSHVDYALYGIVKEDNYDRLLGLVEAGARGFKGLMGISSMKTPTSRDVTLWKALRLLKDTGCPISVHAEDTEIVFSEIERLKSEGRTDFRAHMESRPVIAEIIAIQRAIMLAEDTGGRLHIAHIASGKSVDIIRAAKAKGVRVTCETGPHNLIFTDKDYEKLGPAMFMNPPIRTEEDQNALWEGIMDGTIDMIATDHAPHSEEDKYKSGSVWDSISGCCGLESSVPLMLTLVNNGKLTLEKYVEISSANVAKLFNLYPRKGCIQVGSDADFTIVDLNKEGVIKKENLHSKTKVTAFDGMAVKGMPVYTIIRGNIAMKDGVVAPETFGQFV